MDRLTRVLVCEINYRTGTRVGSFESGIINFVQRIGFIALVLDKWCWVYSCGIDNQDRLGSTCCEIQFLHRSQEKGEINHRDCARVPIGRLLGAWVSWWWRVFWYLSKHSPFAGRECMNISGRSGYNCAYRTGGFEVTSKKLTEEGFWSACVSVWLQTTFIKGGSGQWAQRIGHTMVHVKQMDLSFPLHCIRKDTCPFVWLYRCRQQSTGHNSTCSTIEFGFSWYD